MMIDTPVIVKSTYTLEGKPIQKVKEISNIFERYHQAKSGLSVFQVVNTVWVLRRFAL